jgi:hypothetical protein
LINIINNIRYINFFSEKIYYGTVLAFDYSKHLRQHQREVGIEQRGADHNQGLNEQ